MADIEVGKDYEHTFISKLGRSPQGRVRVLYAGTTFVVVWNYDLEWEQCCKRGEGEWAEVQP